MQQTAEATWKLGPPDQPGWYLTEFRNARGWMGDPKIFLWHRSGRLVWYTHEDTASPGPNANYTTSGDWSTCADKIRTFGPVPGPAGSAS